MNVIVRDDGFHAEDWAGGFVGVQELASRPFAVGLGLDLPPDAEPDALQDRLSALALIRIRFEHFTDGRGLTLAARVRRLGYGGRLRAWGNVLAGQYTLARRSGFDEVEICAELARRQPAEHWHFRGNWRHQDYQSRMRA